MQTLSYLIEHYNQVHIDPKTLTQYQSTLNSNYSSITKQPQIPPSPSQSSKFNTKIHRKHSPKIIQKRDQQSPKPTTINKKNTILVLNKNTKTLQQSAGYKTQHLLKIGSELDKISQKQNRLQEHYSESFLQLQDQLIKFNKKQDVMQQQILFTVRKQIQQAKKDLAHLIRIIQSQKILSKQNSNTFNETNTFLFNQKNQKNQSYRIKQVPNIGPSSPRNKFMGAR